MRAGSLFAQECSRSFSDFNEVHHSYISHVVNLAVKGVVSFLHNVVCDVRPAVSSIHSSVRPRNIYLVVRKDLNMACELLGLDQIRAGLQRSKCWSDHLKRSTWWPLLFIPSPSSRAPWSRLRNGIESTICTSSSHSQLGLQSFSQAPLSYKEPLYKALGVLH